MQVLVTVDTELSSSRHGRDGRTVQKNLQSAIYGGDEGLFGIPFQLEVLRRHGLKGVFFVEALSADVVGPAALREIVDLIRAAGQEVQLHVHTEWLSHYEPADRAALGVTEVYDNVGQFPLEQQTRILAHGIANLKAAGVEKVTAFRAGNFGADTNTLAAAAALGLSYDTSYTVSYAGEHGPCRITSVDGLTDCREIQQVVEVPVTYFDDKLFGRRHLQVCSVSLSEMRNALRAASDAKRKTAVIVSHSFELLNRARNRGNPLHVDRFTGLCRFLAENADKMPTAWFADLERNALCRDKTDPLRSSPLFTLHRIGMQLLGRLYG